MKKNITKEEEKALLEIAKRLICLLYTSDAADD